MAIDYNPLIIAGGGLLGSIALWLKVRSDTEKLRNTAETIRVAQTALLEKQHEATAKVDELAIKVDGRLTQLIAALTAKGLSDMEFAKLQSYGEGHDSAKQEVAGKLAAKDAVIAGLTQHAAGLTEGLQFKGEKGDKGDPGSVEKPSP